MSLERVVTLWCLLSLLVTLGHSRRGSDKIFGNNSDLDVDHESNNRKGRLFNLFTVVRFRNGPCIGTGSRNGTCYTSIECGQRGGSSAGSCASGYGVCCTFAVNCGATSAENCTYFESTGNEQAGQCRITICPCSSNICQLRLDFNTFVSTGPTTLSDSVATTLFGQVSSSGNAVPVSQRGQCLTDVFSVTNPGGLTPPSICGTNTGEHMYLDSSTSCNELAFQLGNAAVGTTLATRSWSIKVTQYSCDFDNLAPDGCTQYFFGATTNVVRSYNYGEHLADQNQNICVRRERNFCKICWATETSTDFAVSGPTNIASGYTNAISTCCGYGTNGQGTKGFDCVIIPGAEKTNSVALNNDAVCGRIGLVTAGGRTAQATICSRVAPFELRFLSDTFEFTTNNKEATAADAGVKLSYILQTC